MTVTRPIIRYHGGKWKLAPWIIKHMADHHTYIEPFGGGGSVLLQALRLTPFSSPSATTRRRIRSSGRAGWWCAPSRASVAPPPTASALAFGRSHPAPAPPPRRTGATTRTRCLRSPTACRASPSRTATPWRLWPTTTGRARCTTSTSPTCTRPAARRCATTTPGPVAVPPLAPGQGHRLRLLLPALRRNFQRLAPRRTPGTRRRSP